MQQKLNEMIDMQMAVNDKADPSWRSEPQNWGRAIWRECAELLDEFNWEWWKEGKSSSSWNTKIELADIWAFGLSHILVRGQASIEGTTKIAEDLQQIYQETLANPDEVTPTIVLLEQVAAAGCNDKFSPGMFFSLCLRLGCDFDELHRVYSAKSALNTFRQLNGYADGTYQKEWEEGQEDNEYLEGLCEELQDLEEEEDELAPGPYDYGLVRLAQLYKGIVLDPLGPLDNSTETSSSTESAPSSQESESTPEDSLFGEALDPKDSGQ